MEIINKWFNNHEAFSSVAATLFIGLVALIVTWIYAAKSKRISEDEIFYNLYSNFNERYDKINDDLQILQAKKEKIKTVETLKSSPYYKTVIDFFNICAEEYYWRGRGRIKDEVWDAWNFGMNYWYREILVIRLAWTSEIEKEK